MMPRSEDQTAVARDELREHQPGQTLGRYELLLPLARGGMAVVWAARLTGSRGFEKLVAVKTMLPDMSDDAGFEQMFLDEANLAARIRSPHVVEILDLGEESGVLYIAMEWVDGEPLNDLMRASSDHGRFPIDVAVPLVMQACAGLHAAHELKDEEGRPLELVHRDVSPHNILVGFDGIAKVSDFGIAKAMAIGGQATKVGEVKGKTAFMSPEQAIGAVVDRRSDVFALGVILYQLTTGVHPFRGQTDGETVANIVLPDPPKRPREVDPAYPPKLEGVVMKALAKDADVRHPTAMALLDDLSRALPPSAGGGMGYERVGAFAESLLGERRMRRREKLTEALAVSEAKRSGPSSTTRVEGAVGGIATLPPPGRRRLLPLVAAIVGGTGLVWWLASSAPEPGPARATSASPPVAAPVTSSVSMPAVDTEDAGLAPAVEAPSPIEPAPAEKRVAKPRPAAARPKAPKAKPAAAPPVRGPSPVVSPVRTPGF